jgi:hypothetical protein
MGAACNPRRAQIFSSSSGEFADSHIFRRVAEALQVALHFGVPVGELQTEGDGLGVHSVGAADLWGVFEFPGAALEHVRQADESLVNENRSLFDEQGLGRVHHVIRG